MSNLKKLLRKIWRRLILGVLLVAICGFFSVGMLSKLFNEHVPDNNVLFGSQVSMIKSSLADNYATKGWFTLANDRSPTIGLDEFTKLPLITFSNILAITIFLGMPVGIWLFFSGVNNIDRYLKIKKQSEDNDMTEEYSEKKRKSKYIRRDDVFYDVFISHASEDKEELVRPLALAMQEEGLKVWYDEMTLKVGDSLRRSIDKGLSNSSYGVIVLSEPFFSKGWPQYELDGLVSKEIEGKKVILPVWHKTSMDQVRSYSPTLADRIALKTSDLSVRQIATQIADVVSSEEDML